MLLINILLVDDHVLFSKSLEIAFSDYPDIKTFKSINDISLLDKFIEEDAPDILLMDINLKNITSEDGLELATPEQTHSDAAAAASECENITAGPEETPAQT